MPRSSPRYVRWDCGFQQDPRWSGLSHYAFRLAVWLESQGIERAVAALPKRFVDPKNIGKHFGESAEMTAAAFRELALATDEDGLAIIMYLRDGGVWLTEVSSGKYGRFTALAPPPPSSELEDGLPAQIGAQEQADLVTPADKDMLGNLQRWWNQAARQHGFQEIKSVTGDRAQKALACLEAGMGQQLVELTQRFGNVNGVVVTFDWLVGSPARFRDVVRGQFEKKDK